VIVSSSEVANKRKSMKTSITVIATALVASVLTLVAVRGQQRSGGSLTALDYAEIQQLVARYAFAIDTCGDNGYDYARLYTRDGVYIDKYSDAGFSKGGVRAEGYEALAIVAGGGKQANACANTQRWDLNHVLVNHVITPTPDGATGRVYLVELWGGTDPSHVLRAGGYDDVYVKTSEGWRFKTRTHVRDKAWHPAALQTPDMMSPKRPTPGPLGRPRPSA
jgi:hypothetical protein